MSIDLGKPKSRMYGRSSTTKRVQAGFTLTVRLDRVALLEVIRESCEAYPKKKSWGSMYGAMLFFRRSDSARLIGYGTITNTGIITPDWSLALVGTAPAYRLELVEANLRDGLVQEVEELQRFLNGLEEELKLRGDSASIMLG